MKTKTVLLMDICRPKQWPTISGDELTASGFPVFGANGKIGFYSEYNHEEPTLLITCRGATCGTMNICEPKSYVTGNSMALNDLKTDEVDMMYLYYYLRFRGFRDVISGSAQPQITRQGLEGVTVPLVPMDVQKIVVAKLSEVERIAEIRKATLVDIDTYLQALFVEMFGDPISNPKGWPIRKLSELANKITDGTHKTPKYQESGIIFLSAKNVKNGELDQVEPKYISEKEHQDLIKRCKPEKGDIVLTKSGSLGDPAIIKFDFEFSIFESLALIKPKADVLSNYLCSYLALPQTKVRLLKEQKGIGVRHLHLVDLRELEVQLPPMDLQRTFSDRLEQVNALKKNLRKSRLDLKGLFNSLLHEAFQ